MTRDRAKVPDWKGAKHDERDAKRRSWVASHIIEEHSHFVFVSIRTTCGKARPCHLKKKDILLVGGGKGRRAAAEQDH